MISDNSNNKSWIDNIPLDPDLLDLPDKWQEVNFNCEHCNQSNNYYMVIAKTDFDNIQCKYCKKNGMHKHKIKTIGGKVAANAKKIIKKIRKV